MPAAGRTKFRSNRKDAFSIRHKVPKQLEPGKNSVTSEKSIMLFNIHYIILHVVGLGNEQKKSDAINLGTPPNPRKDVAFVAPATDRINVVKFSPHLPTSRVSLARWRVYSESEAIAAQLCSGELADLHRSIYVIIEHLMQDRSRWQPAVTSENQQLVYP